MRKTILLAIMLTAIHDYPIHIYKGSKLNFQIYMNRLFFTFLIFCTVSCYSQVSVSLKDLSGTKWKITETGNDFFQTITEYTNSYRKTTTTFKTSGREASVQNKYYLSDYIPSSFEHSRVGKSTRGKYIISYNSYWFF